MSDLEDADIQALWEDGEFVVARARRPNGLPSQLVVSPLLERPASASVSKLQHALNLRGELDPAWAARPVDLVRLSNQPALVVEDPGGEFLNKTVDGPLSLHAFLRLAIGIASSLGGLHSRGIVHKDVKPSNLIVDIASGNVWLTGFGLASRLPHGRQAPVPPEIIAGTLAYMAPEQTGRMNRAVDSRSDLYSLGVTLYEMLTGCLPFSAGTPMEWVHCHTARQPVSPDERLAGIPAPVASIIMKLLAKVQEERYQTAGGVKADLEKCLENFEKNGRIDSFPLGSEDTPDRLLIPAKLYGRDMEVGKLLNSFDRVVRFGSVALVLVSGYAGVGKSSVVGELHRALVPPRGLFASGKFDQLKRDIPYATLAQAFQSLVRQILSQSDEEVLRWRRALVEALGPNARLMVELIPELELLIGEQPPVASLPPKDAQNRFQMVFRRFVGVFARKEHPLALFLDDLQWLDVATLNLLQHLLPHDELDYLLVIGAYRDNEVSPVHPLMRTLTEIRNAGVSVEQIALANLNLTDVSQMVADSLHCNPVAGLPLARIIHEKTGGNPFFCGQFLAELADEKLLIFSHEVRAWVWDIARIQSKGYTYNVADLMVGRLGRLPKRARDLLKYLACLGNGAKVGILNVACGETEEAVHEALGEAARLGLVLRSSETYVFAHDRVQEAAYALIPTPARAGEHLKMGRLLLSGASEHEIEENLFEIVNQLNHGVDSIDDPGETQVLQRLNFMAGIKARGAIAFDSARNYLAQAVALLHPDSWACDYKQTFELFLAYSECEYLNGEFSHADQLFNLLLSEATSDVDKAKVYSLRMRLYQVAGKYDEGMNVALAALRLFGVEFPTVENPAEVLEAEFQQVTENLAGRKISDLLDAPEVTDPAIRSIINLLVDATPCSYIGRPALFPLIALKSVNTSLRYGNTDQSSYGYAIYALMLVSMREDIDSAFQFSEMALKLNDKFDNPGLRGTLLHLHADHIHFWRRPFATGLPMLHQAFECCLNVGDVVYAGFLAFETTWQLIEKGEPLGEIHKQATQYAAFARQTHNEPIYHTVLLEQQFVSCLEGRTTSMLRFDDGGFVEEDSYSAVVKAAFGCGIFFYHAMKQVLAFLDGNFEKALEESTRAEATLGAAMAMPIEATYHFYHALTLAALYSTVAPEQRKTYDSILEFKLAKLKRWAQSSPANYQSRYQLLLAELAKIEGKHRDAMRLYDVAIQSAHASGSIPQEALANELAARFYSLDGFDKIAQAYLEKARECYARWGAFGKVRQIDQRHRYLRESLAVNTVSPSIDTTVGQLDLATVIQMSLAVSGEIMLNRLIEKLMAIAIEHAGAVRGLLLLAHGAELQIEAEAETRQDAVYVQLRKARVTASELPETILRYVKRTQGSVVVDDAIAPHQFAEDPYIRTRRPRSILCLPLVKQGLLTGILYLENELSSRVFTPSRISVLQLLASQAAVSLENARLYQDLQRAEESARLMASLVENSTEFIATATSDGRVTSVNPAGRRLIGLEEDEDVTIYQRRDFHPPGEEQQLTEEIDASLNGKGHWTGELMIQHFKTRAQIPVFQTIFSIAEQGSDRRIGFGCIARDITKLRRAEESLRASERHLNRIINTIPTMVWSALPDGSCDFFNQRWLDYTGLTLDQALGWGWTAAFHPDDLKDEVLAYWQSCLTTGTPVNTELRMRRYDGVYRMFLLLADPLRDETGQIRGWYGTNFDIEDRKLAEEKLRRSEAFLAEGQRVSLTGSFSWNLDQESVTFSEECSRIFGFSPDELVTLQRIGERLHPDDLPMLAVKTEEARTLRNDHDYEIRIQMPDGSIKYLHAISHPVQNREGSLEYVGTIQDVTSRHLAEEQVRKSELHLRQMTETIPEMLWSATAEGAIDYCNGRLLEYTGFPGSEVMGAVWTKLLHPDDVERATQVWHSCVATGDPYVVEVRTFHAADRTYRWCIASALPLLDQQGLIQKWYGTLVDMHERKRADEELRRSELRLREVQNELAHVTRVTTMGELAASIAHEINQPIAGVVINGNACLRWLSRVNDDSVNLKEARETIQRIIRDGTRAGEIIARIRALFKKTDLAKERLDINETIREIIVLARNEIEKRRVALRLELSADLPNVLGDRVQLQQVILNLILNAIDAMATVQGRPRDLIIRTQRHDDREVVVTVRDSGVGLHPEDADKIFAAFHTTKPGGLGIGLPLSRSIVENHSGRLWFTDHGSPGVSFHFTLPSKPH